MPRDRPATTGYERLTQADQFSDDSDDDPLAESSASLQPALAPRYAPITQPRHRSGISSPKSNPLRPRFRRRVGSNAGVDLKAINARLERWADEIASRFKRGKGKSHLEEEARLEIHHSVFQSPEGVRPISAGGMAEPQAGVMTKAEFESVVDSVRTAIRQEIHPSMISQGSSGSYFARNPDGKIVGVFKPKDEEPYAAGNPKWNKWIHRNLFPCCFGRACLIPNLSYVSEAAAYVLDCQLRTHLVPYTDVVWLSSKSFHYPFWDRRGFYRKKKPLPPKPGSFQVFLKGFKDANVFLREHPWPDQYWSGFRTNDTHRNKRKRWTESCRPSTSGSPDDPDSSDDEQPSSGDERSGPPRFAWTEPLKQSFREELEKLVILDYIMRNTDRGLDNWMVKVDWEAGTVSLASQPVHMNMEPPSEENGPRPVDLSQVPPSATRASYPYKTQKPMDATSSRPTGNQPEISIGAIDNSLSWPWKHPDAWRSFPFGWLFLPVDLIGRPFSQKTRDHFLPLLTSPAWWSQTQMALKRVFQVDDDFQERMFAKQIAVMKGQAWNVVEALKTPDHGPLELTRRARVCVWDDLVEVPVAVPMRVTSSELRRTADMRQSMDEADIASSAPTNHVPVEDLMGFATAPVDMPRSGRFEMSSPHGEGAQSPTNESSLHGHDMAGATANQQGASLTDQLAPQPRGTGSYQGPSRALNIYEPARHGLRHQRRYSFATPAARRSGNSIAQHLYPHEAYDGDDIEGDLGYAAAEGQMGNQRKVIVERLEAVKSRNPVFTWC
ncbi:Phosphatidylinositol 4-kinase lsb6 [Tolypocladium ophioglossoides CBS 100239]|uniref:Phosphatidylinositol 4-kinase n=1 Tax=Tolypocladium ophioglossoides (strain CBS 100239) TaxID=1163406 RepID=A0A0L0NH32_TOLOC|nr:Phosphatidylinositol 4-kinase lsb6 [Tolypocladium ophioglossoides CBS 100239]